MSEELSLKKLYIFFVLFQVLLAVVLSACTNDTLSTPTFPTEIPELLTNSAPDIRPSSNETKTWQEAYAELLRESSGKEFFLCDIDRDGILELLISGPSTDMAKYANYDVYTYKNYLIEYLGEIGTLSWSGLWLDNNSGILGYSYGAGGGGTYRFYIDNGVLCYDGEVYGYYYDSAGNRTKWFRGSDGDNIIVTEETENEYECIWKSMIKLESYSITEDNITTVIYDGV